MMGHCISNALWLFSFFIYSIFSSELSLLERVFSRLSREELRLGNSMFSVVIYLLLLLVSNQYWTGIMATGINAKNPRIFPIFLSAVFLSSLHWFSFWQKCGYEQETCFMKFIEANDAECHWLQQFLSFKMFYSLSVQHGICFF